MKVVRWTGCFLLTLLFLGACGLSDQEKAEIAERKRLVCLNKICPGDKEPAFDSSKEVPFKINGRWFLAPKPYGGFDGSLAFFWPSKTPARMVGAEKSAPEFEPTDPGRRISNFYEVGIEIFLRSNNIPPEPRGYALIELAEKNGWIADRKTLRAGLDEIQMKHVIGPRGHYIDHVTYYVATELRGVDGKPPVTTCSHDVPESGGGTGFLWKPGIWVGTRMNQRHCADWPEIYQETMRILSLLREIQ